MLSETFSHRAWALLNGAFETVLQRPNDIDARSAMLLGAHFAGIAIEQSMLGAAHACANPLTARFDLAHGPALASLLAHVVRWNGAVAQERYAPFLEAAGLESIEALAHRLEDLAGAGSLNMRLRDYGVTADSLPELAELAAEQWTGTFNPRPFDTAGAVEIYRAAY
jgi:alcohol dehydrogenase